jgi:hypothetical protein
MRLEATYGPRIRRLRQEIGQLERLMALPIAGLISATKRLTLCAIPRAFGATRLAAIIHRAIWVGSAARCWPSR